MIIYYKFLPVFLGQKIKSNHYLESNIIMDATAIFAILGVIGSMTVFTVLGYRITRLMKVTQSED